MKIETKFNIGDWVWFVCSNKIIKDQIVSFSINNNPCNKKALNISYRIYVISLPDSNTVEVDETRCFATKEELLKSL